MILSKHSSIGTISKRFKHWHSVENQFWQRSIMPTMHFQPSLPRLPIPKLEATCERYLAAQQPLLLDEAFKKTQTYVTEFKDTIGKELQKILLLRDKNNKHTSYISEPWFDAYLSDRKPLPINYNPVLVFVNDERPEYNTQLVKATNMLISSLRFYKSLKDQILEPEVFHMNPKKSDTPTFQHICSIVPSFVSWYASYTLFNAYPLDMSQYHSLFNSTRIPKTTKDVIYQNSKARHVLVQHNGHFYTFDVLDENGYILSPEALLGNLKTILDDPVPANEFPLGVLTTLDRNEWADLRQHFESLGNKESTSLIDSALFNICFDDVTVEEDPIILCRNFLHGDGINRWFDKSFSLIVTKDGVGGVNFEHSWGDGVAVLRYFQDIHKDSLTDPKIHPDTKPNLEPSCVRRLELNIDDKMKSAIKNAVKSYKSTCDSLDMNVVLLDGLGKDLCKQYKVSPDAIMQLGFQVAYHKLTGKCAGSYESCSTAAFRHGRTETIRPCTAATKAYSVAINSKQPPSNDELIHLISECSKYHGKLTREAAMGQGFDRHLYALRLLTNTTNKSKSAIFEDPAYAAINHNIISTSTLSSPSVWAGGFGPVVPDGFGLAYSIRDDNLGVLVTTHPGANGKDYGGALKKSYEELLSILQTKD